MNLKKIGVGASLALAFGATVLQAQAANLVAGDVLTITAGVPNANLSNIVSGSWFGMDQNGNSKIAGTEKVAVSQGTQGIVIGTTQAAGSAGHSGAPTGADTSLIDAPWAFFGNTGMHWTSAGITGGTAAGLSMAGWNVAWNGIAGIPMGTGAWNPLNCAALGVSCSNTNGVATFTWDGIYGHAYTLDYAATVPLPPNDGNSGFGGVQYYLHLVGTVVSGSAPHVASTIPANAAGGIASNLNKYVVAFDKAVTGVTTGTITLNNGATVSAVNCTTDKKTCVFTLAGVAAATTYTVTFYAGTTDTATPANALVLPANKTFTTTVADSTVPTVTPSPANLATGIDAGTAITLTFSEAMDPNTVASAFSLTGGGTTVGTTTSTTDYIVYTFTPTSALSAGVTYTIGLTTAAKDLANNALAATSNTFTIQAAAAAAAPTVPASGGAGGGCTMNPASKFDLGMILALFGSLGYVGWRRARN